MLHIIIIPSPLSRVFLLPVPTPSHSFVRLGDEEPRRSAPRVTEAQPRAGLRLQRRQWRRWRITVGKSLWSNCPLDSTAVRTRFRQAVIGSRLWSATAANNRPC